MYKPGILNFFLKTAIIEKGPNGILSKIKKGEKYLKIICDNTGRQNKNNLQLVKLNFMVSEHIKFKYEWKFWLNQETLSSNYY